ncbi:hypothetical protein CW304_18235 [Bacillus sp. UFRGS-B20]|nr:hypothetical protein CW304_18235 [Bacillus sp. UFRGS-B20]
MRDTVEFGDMIDPDGHERGLFQSRYTGENRCSACSRFVGKQLAKRAVKQPIKNHKIRKARSSKLLDIY